MTIKNRSASSPVWTSCVVANSDECCFEGNINSLYSSLWFPMRSHSIVCLISTEVEN